MSKKHFIKIAASLHNMRPTDSRALSVWKSMVEELAYTFQELNPNFDRNRFYDACGFSD